MEDERAATIQALKTFKDILVKQKYGRDHYVDFKILLKEDEMTLLLKMKGNFNNLVNLAKESLKKQDEEKAQKKGRKTVKAKKSKKQKKKDITVQNVEIDAEEGELRIMNLERELKKS